MWADFRGVDICLSSSNRIAMRRKYEIGLSKCKGSCKGIVLRTRRSNLSTGLEDILTLQIPKDEYFLFSQSRRTFKLISYDRKLSLCVFSYDK